MPKIVYNPLSTEFDYINTSSDFKDDFKSSSGTWNFVSSQIFSGGAYYTKLTAPTTDRQLANKKYVDDAVIAGGGYTDEQAQDAVGSIMGKGLTYNDAGNLITVTDYIASSNIISRFAPSKSIRNGLQTVTNAYVEISHGLSLTPNYWNVRPSGTNINFGITTKVDATKIYVYLTANGSRDVYWYAST